MKFLFCEKKQQVRILGGKIVNRYKKLLSQQHTNCLIKILGSFLSLLNNAHIALLLPVLTNYTKCTAKSILITLVNCLNQETI